MGLDAVEIVMAVEDAFDIKLEESEAEKILTPRQLIDLVLTKTTTTTAETCLTHRAFNLMRAALARSNTLPRKQVRPDASLRTAFPRPQRRAQLQQLAIALAIPHPPELIRPEWLKACLVAFVALAGMATAFCFARSAFPSWFTALLAVAAAGYLGAVVTRPLQRDFPKGLDTIGDLARWVMAHKTDLAIPETSAWTRDQVAARVREIVIEQLGCNANYREDARFIEDLGLS
jgi:acyl carrier protein